MFTINYKGTRHPKNERLVKIEVVFYRSGYSRVTQTLKGITGFFKDWNESTQSFIIKDEEHQKKNKFLFDLKQQYLQVGDEWEAEGRDWSPIEWKYCFSGIKKIKKPIDRKAKSLSQMIDFLIEKFSEKERLKNGKYVTSSSNVKEYEILKRLLTDFTKKKYDYGLGKFFFGDIDEKFISDFVQYLQKRGKSMGNQGGVRHRLKKLKAICNYGVKMRIPGANIEVFEPFIHFMQQPKFESKALPLEVLKKIENIDRSSLTKIQNFHIDMFLFSFYAGGISNVDVTYLTWERIKDGVLKYERMKVTKEAIVPLISKANELIMKYSGTGYSDYVFPILTHKHQTEEQKRNRVESFSLRLNMTLAKVAESIGYNGKITWYSARGSFITALIDAGIPPSLVAIQAGNSAAIIEKHYYKITNPKNVKSLTEGALALP